MSLHVKWQTNPENIVYYDGKLYVICNGYGKLSLMDVIDESTFTKDGDDITVCNNPQKMIADSKGNIFIQGYDANYAGTVYSYNGTKKDRYGNRRKYVDGYQG